MAPRPQCALVRDNYFDEPVATILERTIDEFTTTIKELTRYL